MAKGRERADEHHSSSPSASSRRSRRARPRGNSRGSRASGSCRTTSAAGATTPGQRHVPHHAAARPRLRRPSLGGYRQIEEAGGHVRKGEKGTPILYVEWRQQRRARDEAGNPVLDENGRKKLEWVQRDCPLVNVQHVFNVEQAEDLNLRWASISGRSRRRLRSGKGTSAPKRSCRAVASGSGRRGGQPRDAPDQRQTTRTPGRDRAVDRADGAPIAPEPGSRDDGTGRRTAGTRRIAAADRRRSTPGAFGARDGARDDWARSHDTGPSR